MNDVLMFMVSLHAHNSMFLPSLDAALPLQRPWRLHPSSDPVEVKRNIKRNMMRSATNSAESTQESTTAVWLCNMAMENGHNLWWCVFKTLGFSIAILNDQKVIYLLTCWLTIANHQLVKLVDMEQEHSCCIINIGFCQTVFVVGEGHQPNLIRLIMAHQRLGSKSV